jgi:Mg/Co/Ni transporter MgtE
MFAPTFPRASSTSLYATSASEWRRPAGDTCFVVDEADIVIGRLGRGALRGNREVMIAEAMTPGPSTVRPSARLDAMVERMREQNLTNVPVTTSDGRLVGLLVREDAERAYQG